MTFEFSGQIFEKSSNIKFNQSPSSGSRVVPCGQTDRPMDMTKLVVSFRNFANTHKNEYTGSCLVLLMADYVITFFMQKWNMETNFSKTPQNRNFMKSVRRLSSTDGRTDGQRACGVYCHCLSQRNSTNETKRNTYSSTVSLHKCHVIHIYQKKKLYGVNLITEQRVDCIGLLSTFRRDVQHSCLGPTN